jgi:hypothetical protein
MTRGGLAGKFVGLERVGAAERVFASRNSGSSGGSGGGGGGRSSWYTAVALGTYGGGHVGFFGDVDAGEATLRVVAALVDAAPGVNSLAAQRQLRAASRGMFGGWGGRGVSNNKAPTATFACYAVCSMTITTAFVAVLARLILAS